MHTPSTQEAELIGAVGVPDALHTAVVVACCGITTGAVGIDVAHDAFVGGGGVTNATSTAIVI